MGMLVLSRQRDEIVDIGNDTYIQVVDIRGDKVRIGIVAPPGVKINRREVTNRINQEISDADEARQAVELDQEKTDR